MFLRLIATSLMLFFGAFAGSIAGAFENPQKDSEAQESILKNEYQNIGFIHGRYLTVRVETLINRLGEYETRVFWQEPHMGLDMFNTEQLILVGRDLDENQLIETWFYQDEVGNVNYTYQKQKSVEDLDAVRAALNQFFDSEGRWVVSIALKETLKALTFTAENEYIFWNYYETRQTDNLDLKIRLTMMEKENPRDLHLSEYKKILASNISQLSEEYKKFVKSGRLKNIGADVALALAGGAVVKGVAKVGSVVLKNPGVKQALARLERMGEEHIRRLESAAQGTTQWAKEHAEASKQAGTQISERLMALPVAQRVGGLISHLSFESSLKKAILGGLKSGVSGLTNAIAKNGKYAATSTAVQLVAESVARGYMTVAPSVMINEPVKTTKDFLKNIANDKDLLENLGYMTAETLIVSGANESLEKRGVGLGKRLVICGVISAIDSVAMGYLVKGEGNPTKVAEDVAWEGVIGNSQVMILDRQALVYFTQLGEKLSNKAVKYLGTLFVIVDQYAGYYVYNKYPDFVEKNVLPKIKLIPIFAPSEE